MVKKIAEETPSWSYSKFMFGGHLEILYHVDVLQLKAYNSVDNKTTNMQNITLIFNITTKNIYLMVDKFG
jgi:hypothetical protein